ncbi:MULTISPECIES: peptidoglycan recognition protein family protein [unclassified Streptomyces]|uniref:peptidoglycan recognition protein family protein n=1 Tax=unclassified Streptomyces TaxID=2593676 RepID=UPI002DD82D23|nr:N-acetylmuramoyl-L-alanine amidase [Streptomyces sp. NBC_01763]WSC39567.1 N-acetylmuramoyl-L-alanine amidase [Streptomyces sp. NBC_01763]WSF84148.1 N-acetylmuramoyl-L-alanine amidase [Streptomyces sp. NBC_01744]
MAAPLTADELLKALGDEGVTVVQVGDWRTHNRNHKGPWGPVHGSLVHHTVTSGTAATVEIVRDGYADLPGPLCHGMIAKDGRVHLVGYGRTNHAGGGCPHVLDQVIAESYGARPTPPTRGNSDGVEANRHFYGWECENLGDGRDPWPVVQYDAIVRAQAAVIRAHRAKGDEWGEDAKSVLGHLEWSADKVDPIGFTMPGLRADVAERLKHPASWDPTEEDDMPTRANPTVKKTTGRPAGEWLPVPLAGPLVTGPADYSGTVTLRLGPSDNCPASWPGWSPSSS